MPKQETVIVNDKMQKNYRYVLSKKPGKNFHPNFKPDLTPKEVLEIGAFGGRYMRDCQNEFPKSWFVNAKFHPEGKPGHDKNINFFGVDASQPLKIWQENGWIHRDDPRGWFQWYCRYYQGRRMKDDERQIKRWVAMKRHLAQVVKNCQSGDITCRKKQRQALLHWAYDGRKY